MENIRLLSIMPYNTLRALIVRAAEKFPNIELVGNEVGLIEEGAEIARQYDPSSYDAVISRGGTKLCIEQVTDRPVFDIPISYYDLFNIFNLVKEYDGKLAIVCYENIADYIRSLQAVINHNYKTVVIQNWENIRSIIEELRREGYTLILGDAAAVAFANEVGLQSMLLSSGIESVEQSFENIDLTFRHFRSVRRKSNYFEAYMSSFDEQLLVTDPQLLPIYSNNLLGTPEQFSAICEELYAASLQTGRSSLNFHLDGRLLLGEVRFNAPLQQYYFRFRLAPPELQHNRSRYKSIQLLSREEVRGIYDDSETFLNNLVNMVLSDYPSTAAGSNPLLITSESGSEKTRLACRIFLRVSSEDASLTSVNCGALTRRELQFLTADEASPLLSLHSYVLFKDMQLLDPALLDELIRALRPFSGLPNCRFLFTYELTYSAADKDRDRFYINTIKNLLGCTEIPLKPLRSSTEDIGNYAILYIKQKQEESSHRVIGIEPEAYELLQEYSWPRNLNQLRHVLDEAIVSARTPWITARSIKLILKKESDELGQRSGQALVSLDGSMDDIMRDVVRQVLAEEHQNKTRTAERLGISRSTLWRLLQAEQNDKRS